MTIIQKNNIIIFINIKIDSITLIFILKNHKTLTHFQRNPEETQNL
jgi:hypothetical protein